MFLYITSMLCFQPHINTGCLESYAEVAGSQTQCMKGRVYLLSFPQVRHWEGRDIHTNTPASPGTFLKEGVHTDTLQPGDLAMSARLLYVVQSLEGLWESWGPGWSFSGVQHPLSDSGVSVSLFRTAKRPARLQDSWPNSP